MAICLSYVRFLFVNIGKQRSWDEEANMQVEVRIYVSHHGDVLWLDKRTGGVHGFDEPCVQGLAVSVRDCIFNDILIYSSLGKSTNITRDWCYNGCGNTVCTPSLASVSFEYRRLLSSGM